MADIYNNPVIPPSPSVDDYYNQSAQRIQQIGLRTQQMLAPEEPEPTVRTAKVAIDSANNKLFIGGYVVDRNDDTNVAALSKYAGQDAPLPEGNWEEIDPGSFAQYVQGIRDPGTLKLMAKNFGMGVDEMQQMAGLGLQWLGAETAGQYLADQTADLAPNQVYSRNFTDIGSSPENGVLDWMAATIGRLGPNVVESAISAAAGAAIGGAVSGPAAPAGAPIGAIAGFFGKTAVKKALLEAAKKRLKGETLDAAEKKLLLSAGAMTNAATNAAKTRLMSPAAVAGFVDEATLTGAQAVGGQVARRAAQVGGAAGLSTASNIFQQTGQAYGETMADGSEGNRAVALGVGVLGGLADTIPEFILAGRLFSELGGDVVSAAKKQKSAMDLLKSAASGRTGRIVKGVTGGAAIEGVTEGFQEVLQIAANPVLDLNSAEGANRVVNAFAAGALMGGVMGGAGNAFAGSLANNKTEANLLLPVSQSDPAFAQYREDLKAKIGEKEVNKIYPPMAPQVMGARPSRAEFDAAQRARMDAITGMGTLRGFAGQPPVPLSAGEPTTFQAPQAQPFVPPTGRGTPIPGMSGVATGTLPEGVTPTVFPGQPLPPPPAPSGPQTISMGGTMTPGQMGGMGTFEQFQAAAMQQAMAAQQAAQQAAAAPAPAPLTRMPGGSALQQAATGELPGAQPPGSMMLRRGPGSALAQTAEMQGPAAPMPGSPTVAMNRLLRGGTSGQAAATMVPPLRPTSMVGRAGDISLRRSGQATGRIIPPAAPEKVATSAPSPAGGRIDALAFLTNLVENNKTSFTKDDLRRALFPKTSLVRRTKQYTMTDTVIDRLIREELVSEGPIGTYTVDTEKVRATQPGTGTGSATPAGERGGKDGGAGKGRGLRKGAKATREEPAPEAEGPPTGSEQAQAEEDVQPVVTVGPEGLLLKHGTTRDSLTLEDITILRSGSKQSKRGKVYGGFYAHSAEDVQYAEQYAAMEGGKGKVLDVLIRPGTKILRIEGDVTRLTPAQIEKWTSEGYGAVVGNDIRGRTEYAIIDKNVISGLKEAPSPKGEGVAATPSKTAAEVATETKAEAKARKAAEAKRMKDIGRVNKAIVDANNAKADERITSLAAVARLGADEKLSSEARALAQDHIATELSELETILLNARLADLGYKDLSPDDKAELAADAIRGSDAVEPNAVPKGDLDEVYSAIATIRQQTEEMKALAGKGNDTPAKREAFKKNFLSLMSWAKGPGISEQAQWTARAYLEEYKGRTSQDWAGVEQAFDDIDNGRYMLSTFDLVENPIDENGRPAKGVNPVRVKAIVDSFKRGLAKAPQFYVYKNQADLQRRNPSLYQQAVGSRPQGDFDTAPASGFAFDGKVLVFTDRIPTEKYMRLLLAHESIGHFGMRSLLPASKFDALMDYVYENNVAVRSAVDSKLGVRPTGVAPMSRRGFLKGTSSVIGAAVVPKMPRIPAKLDVNTFITAYTELRDKLGNINNPDSVGKMGDLFLEILSPIKGENASDAKQAVNKMDSILDNARRYVDDNMNRTLDNLEQRLEFGPDDDYLTYWFEENEAEAAPLLKQFSSLIEEAYQKRNVEIADHVRSTLDMVKNKLGGSAKTEARSSADEDVDMLGARREAVEEYMAKYAEKLDSSVITRVWNAIKDVLNKLGIKFEDDIVRYLVSQARRTVREGSSMFTPSTFALNVHTITTNNGTGRFSQQSLYSAQQELSNAFHIADAPITPMERINQNFKDYGIDGADTLERFVRNVFRLRNYNALRSHGAKRFEDLKGAMRDAAMALRNTYNRKLAGLLATTGDTRRVVSYALIVSRRIADRRFMLDKELRNGALLTLGDKLPDGTRDLVLNKDIFEKLLKMGTLSRDELNNGAEVTFEETVEYGKTVKRTEKIPGVKEKLGRDLTDNEYNIYVKTRRDLAELDVERLKGQYQNFLATEDVTTKGIRKVLADKELTDADATFIKGVVNHAKGLFQEDIEYDERGIPDITPKAAARMEKYFAAVNTAVVKKEFTDDLKAEVRKFYLPKPTKDKDGNLTEPSAEALAEGNKKSEAAIKKIEEFRSRRTEFTGLEEQGIVYTVQDKVKEIVLADAAFEKGQMAARRSIASSHTPLWREGSWQVRVEAQINGQTVKLHPDVQNKLIYSLHTKRSESESAAAFFNEKMKGLEYSGLVYNKENGEYKTQTFKLFAVPSKTVDSVASDPSIDIDNFLYTLRVLGQPLTPDKHAKAITMLTAPGSALRKALRFDDTAGYDPFKTVEAIARHVTTRSSLIARTRYQPYMRDLMDLSSETGQKWFGDKEAVMTAKENFDKATDPKVKSYWQDALTTELYKFITTNPGAKDWDGSRATFSSQPKQASLGMRDYSDSVKELEWMMDSANINESTFEGKRLAAGMKMLTSVGFLGGMFTQFAQNLMSPATNVMPYLASKDSQTGFGGGFGIAVMPTYLKAFNDVVGLRGLIPTDPIKDAEGFEKIATEIKAARDAKDTAKEAELVQQYNLSYYEALNIAREIREGKLIPAQANALLETARGLWTGPVSKGFLKFSDWYMSPFNVSEQATRRATFLTAFRLEFDRLVQAKFDADKASEMARVFAVDTVDKTLGEYSNTNRPPVWRDGWQSMLFVYKTYPLTSLSLFWNMSRNGKIAMLTALYVLAGAAGFPLVDDMEDFIDTLSQRLGLDIGQGPSVRMAIIRQLEEVFPGWSDLILRGPMNHYTGADVGAKFGLEDFIPGTGIFLKGANTTEELKGIAGPVVGMGLSMGKFAYDAIRAPLSSTVSAVDVFRESPISLMRAGGDVAAYLQNGAIVDRRGYVVSPEVSAMTMAARLLGFYPADAARQYDFIKYANRMNYDYKEVGMAYKLAWIKAKKAGNEREAARIVREVNEWNEANRGGPGFLRNFLKNAQRQLKEANRPAGERFLKAAPVASRAEYDRFLEYITGE